MREPAALPSAHPSIAGRSSALRRAVRHRTRSPAPERVWPNATDSFACPHANAPGSSSRSCSWWSFESRSAVPTAVASGSSWVPSRLPGANDLREVIAALAIVPIPVE